MNYKKRIKNLERVVDDHAARGEYQDETLVIAADVMWMFNKRIDQLEARLAELEPKGKKFEKNV